MTHSKYNYLVIALITLSAAVLGSFNYVVDPYNKNQQFDFDLPKSTVAKSMHYPLYKLMDFQHEPRDALLLGDSRTAALQPAFFEELGASVFNMAYAAGTVYEIIDSFWFAVERHSLKRVYIGLPFNVYSASNTANRFTEAEPMVKGSFSYYFSPFVAKAGAYAIASRAQGRNLKSEAPDMNKEQFWAFQLGDITAATYESWRASVELDTEFMRIVEYCKSNGIELTFFFPPTHTDLQDKVAEYHLEEQRDAYVRFLSGIARVVDFDFPNALTSDKNNFKDPYHFTPEVTPFVVRALLDLPLEAGDQANVRTIE